MAGQPPSPQQGQMAPGGAPGGAPPNIPPELLMVLLSHLMVSGGQSPGQPGQGGQPTSPPPKDGSQVPSLSDLLPHILQALAGNQVPPQAAGQPKVAGQQQQQPQQKPPQGQQGQAQSNPLQSILQSLGIKLQ